MKTCQVLTPKLRTAGQHLAGVEKAEYNNRDGKYVVVVVVNDAAPERHWIITAYIARKLAEGEIEWKRE